MKWLADVDSGNSFPNECPLVREGRGARGTELQLGNRTCALTETPHYFTKFISQRDVDATEANVTVAMVALRMVGHAADSSKQAGCKCNACVV